MTTEQPFVHVTYTDGDGREWSLWRRHNAGIDDSPERARWLMYPVPASLMVKFGYAPAPPSPPVAPEPAQETWSQPELDEVEREATAMHAALGNAVPAQENQASSGEAAGDGLTHHGGAGGGDEDGYNMATGTPTHRDVRNWTHAAERHKTLGKHLVVQLLRYIDQQEQAEREAAGLRESLQLTTESRDSWHADCFAERVQKEALDATLRVALRDLDALRAERDELKVRLDAANAICRVRLAALNHANDGRVLLRCHDCDELTFVNHDCLATQQPAPAAPVAKTVQTSPFPAVAQRSVAKEEAAAEAWVPKVGDLVSTSEGLEGLIVAIDGSSFPVLIELPEGSRERWIAGALTLVTAAPQPPATTGEDRPVMLGELVAALRELAMFADADTAPRHIAWQNLANRLEGLVGK